MMSFEQPNMVASLIALMALSRAVNASFGNYFSTGPTSSGAYIVSAVTTLVLPDAPKPVVANFGLWPGMGMSNGDLIQGIATSYPGDNVGADCGVVGKNWCAVATTLKNASDYQTDGPAVTAYPGEHITYSYHLNKKTKAWNQSVKINGTVVSTLTTSKGAVGDGWGTAEECDSTTACGTIPDHEWLNTVITLNKADPGFGNTVATNGATGKISTPDGGVTWKVPKIHIDQFTFS